MTRSLVHRSFGSRSNGELETSLGLVCVDRGDMPDHGISPATQSGQFDDKLAIVIGIKPWLAGRHQDTLRVTHFDRAEGWFYPFGERQRYPARRGRHLAADRRAGALKERMGERGRCECQ